MIIVIDAYNVLKQVLGVKYIHDPDKEHFINSLHKYGGQKGHSIIAVFDGGPHEWPTQEKVKSVVVVYSGIHENADTWIKNYMLKNVSGNILLISTDRELGRFIQRLGIQSMDALDFYELLHETLRRPSKQDYKQSAVVKTSNNREADIDTLMHDASKTVPQKAEDVVHDRKSKARHLSKKEKQIMQKLKKL